MSSTIKKEAGDRLGRIAQVIKENEGIRDYAVALNMACERNPSLFYRYTTGNVGDVRQYRLSEVDREMLSLQKDPVRVRFLANNALDRYARETAGGEGSNQYYSALAQVWRDNPRLRAASETGFIGSDDYELLGMLLPPTPQ